MKRNLILCLALVLLGSAQVGLASDWYDEFASEGFKRGEGSSNVGDED